MVTIEQERKEVQLFSGDVVETDSSCEATMTAWVWLLLLGLPGPSRGQRSEPMFVSVTKTLLPPDYENNPTQLNYGMAVTDVDGDGDLEVLVAGYNGPNLVLKYDQSRKKLFNIAVDNRSSPYYALRDRQGNAIGVTACDIDGDGREEIYFLNTNNAFSGRATYSDKLFKFRNGRFEDLLSDDINEHRDVANRMAGRSVACVDRKGTGRYAIYIANYASGNVAPHALIEMDEAASDVSKGIIALSNVAEEAGVNKFTGGRGVVVGPIVSQTRSDIFCDNEYGPNFLFRNNGDGTFTDVAASAGVEDPMQHGRGVALADFNRDGKTDIVYGNWNGPHRLFLQLSTNRKQRFKDIASQKFSMPSPVRTIIAADFDNDNELEVFFNNIAYRGPSANRLFRVSRREHSDPLIEELNVGEAAEPDGRGTGATVTDFDGDGQLDLLVSHGESAAQPTSVFKVRQGSSNRWLRVVPRTQFGAFARGAKVVAYTKRSGPHTRASSTGALGKSEQEKGVSCRRGRRVHVPGAQLEQGSSPGLCVIVPHGSFFLQTRAGGERLLRHRYCVLPPVLTGRVQKTSTHGPLNRYPGKERLSGIRGLEQPGVTPRPLAARLEGIEAPSGAREQRLRSRGERERTSSLAGATPPPVPRKDVATSVEVFWPDGRSVARPLEPSDMNSVLEIPYPKEEEEEATPAVEIECGNGFTVNENGRCTDMDECTQFPSVCPRDRPICINTYGAYKCRANKRCGQGFEPNDEGTACVAQVAYFEGNRSSACRFGVPLSQISLTVLALVTFSLQA
ncbi:hypothetical protein MATL_G00185310 [Megalops atlanticus]|uniref:EGF-like calcium-binding domain-containing protein n=1 Tax=Megalops atlanticus TaxID=7932 RepID=A0A9D3T1A6_MEGAT|nr:hypothetical protein MATL_G00185310 [Megalops atlanticus]